MGVDRLQLQAAYHCMVPNRSTVRPKRTSLASGSLQRILHFKGHFLCSRM
jgi:hypothetical protein